MAEPNTAPAIIALAIAPLPKVAAITGFNAALISQAAYPEVAKVAPWAILIMPTLDHKIEIPKAIKA